MYQFLGENTSSFRRPLLHKSAVISLSSGRQADECTPVPGFWSLAYHDLGLKSQEKALISIPGCVQT